MTKQFDALAAAPETVNIPQTVRDLAGMLGWPPALKLVDAFGGLTIEIPKGRATAGGIRREALIEIVGVKATDLLMAALGGSRLYVPACKNAMLRIRNEGIVRAYSGGTDVAELARTHSLSDRQIWTILKQTDLTSSPQAALF